MALCKCIEPSVPPPASTSDVLSIHVPAQKCERLVRADGRNETSSVLPLHGGVFR